MTSINLYCTSYHIFPNKHTLTQFKSENFTSMFVLDLFCVVSTTVYRYHNQQTIPLCELLTIWTRNVEHFWPKEVLHLRAQKQDIYTANLHSACGTQQVCPFIKSKTCFCHFWYENSIIYHTATKCFSHKCGYLNHLSGY